MIIPSSHTAVFILLIVGMFAWGIWANTLKATGNKWRFELFCFDFAIGAVVAAVLLALTLGSLGFDGFSFWDELSLAGKRQDVFAVVAGMIFNLGNMLLLGAISVAGLAFAFPAGMGMALIIGSFLNFAMNPGGQPAFLFGGVIVVLIAVILDALAFRGLAAAKSAAGIEPGKKPKKARISMKGVFLSIAGGIFLGAFTPFVQIARSNENGLGPYSLGVFFSLGILFSTFVYNLFFMNLPVQGEPVEISQYLRSKLKPHMLGVFGGMLWYGGMLARLVTARAGDKAQVREPVAWSVMEAGMIIAALCGLFIWREADGADGGVKSQLGMALLLLVAGIVLSAFGMATSA